MKNLDETQLIERSILGSETAFERIVEINQGIVINVVNKMIENESQRKDVYQEVFIKVYKSLKSFKGESKLSTWVGKVAYTTCLTHLSKRKLEFYDDLEKIEAEYLNSSNANSHLEKKIDDKALMNLVQAELNKLPILLRTILTLFHKDEQSYEEIAEIVGLPLGTVKSHLHRGRNLLKTRVLKNNSERI